MAKTALYNMEGAAIGEIELSDDIFAAEINVAAMHLVVRSILANKRQGTQSAKTRTEVRGGGRKIYRQKGTGNARHHGNRAPQFTHGGVVFAPKPRDYSYTLNKKVKRLALKSALSAKAAEGKVVVVDGLDVAEIKTKAVASLLNGLEAKKAMLVTPEVNEKVVKSARNIPGVVTSPAKLINVYDIVNAGQLVIDKAALAVIEEVFA